jgi:ATP-dependent DNA ligase
VTGSEEALSAIPPAENTPATSALAVELDLGGIVAKRMDAPYLAGRQPAWRKIRNQAYSRQEALGFRR